MLNQLTHNISSAVVMLISIACITFGVAGYLNLYLSDNADIMPALTPMLSLATFLTGTAMLSYLQRWYVLTRLFGVVLWLSAAYSVFIAKTQMSVFLPPTVALVGSVYLFAGSGSLAARWARYSGLILLILATALFISLWTRGFTTLWATNPIVVTAAMVIITLLGFSYTLLPQAINHPSRQNAIGLTIGVAIIVATISLWTVLSNQHIDNIRQRGELNLQKSSEAISDKLNIHNEALTRLIKRWNTIGLESRNGLLALDAQTYLHDFDLIEAMVTFNEQGQAVETFSQVTDNDPVELLNIDSIMRWRRQNFAQENAVVVAKSLVTQQPRFLLVYPIKNPNSAPLQLAVVLNIKTLLQVNRIGYLDFFDTYLSLSQDYYLPINSEHFKTISATDFAQHHFFQLSTELPVFGNQPMTFHAALNDPGVFWQNARINQFVLLVGILLALLFLATFDVNSRLNRERRKLFNIAQFDSVTRLIRRDVLEQRMQSYLTNNPHLQCSVLFIDLDGFKTINDNLGIKVGNAVLNSVAERLRRHQKNNIELSRFSSDEFIMFAPATSPEQAELLANQVLASLREKFQFSHVELYLTGSIGISTSKLHHNHAEELIQNADVAMSTAKARGGNTFQLFKEAMGIQYEKALELRNKLQTAIEQEQLEVFYQPYVSAATGEIIGAEALARWRQPDGSFISPADFIPVAEQTGQIIPLSKLMMSTAMKQLQQLKAPSNFVLSLNLSVKQFQRENIISSVSELAKQYQIPFSQLQFELTESVMVDDANKVFSELAELRTLGCHVAIDDFGTGFSSLAYLNKLPVDILKIDREFTRTITTDSATQTICSAIISMAHGLNKTIIVEGIETVEQAAYFKQHGCMGLQGFMLFKPMPFDELKQLLGD